MQVIRDVAELDVKLAECDRAEAVSDDALRAVLGSFRLEALQRFTGDPFSDGYRAAQLDLYRQITGEPYSTAKEITKFDIEAATRRPFPFYTESCETLGEYFMAIGFVLRAMALKRGSRVLEFGPGWGHTSLWLAQLGHRVTVIDIEPDFCELISRRAAEANVSIEVINGDFFRAESEARQFDAVLFYDCFHHCDDHLRLLKGLKRILAPGGRLFFGAEPIVADFPVPWGLRLDGWALWGVRKNGWMELGFRDDYFARALAHTGWFGRRMALAGMDRLRVWEACHREEAVFRFTADDPRLHSRIGVRQDGAITIQAEQTGSGLHGPYIALPAGHYVARIGFKEPPSGKATMDVVHHSGNTRLAKRRLESTAVADLPFTATTDVADIEIRLLCEKRFRASVLFVEIALADAPSETR